MDKESTECVIFICAETEFDERNGRTKVVKKGGYVCSRSALTSDYSKAKRFPNEDAAEEFMSKTRFEDRDGSYDPVIE